MHAFVPLYSRHECSGIRSFKFWAEETLCPLQLLFTEYFVTATVTKLEQYAVDNIGQAHLQGRGTETLEMHAACVLCKKKTRKWKKKKWLFGVNRSRWNQPAKVILVINKGWMDVEGKNTVDWPDCWIHLKDLWSIFLVSGSLFYSWQFCNRQSSPPGLLLYDRMTDSGPVCGWVPMLWHLRYFGYFSVPLWF